jgi:3-phytase
MSNSINAVLAACICVFTACFSAGKSQQVKKAVTAPVVVQPRFITDTVQFDSDDPAVWINPADASKSLIIGTDKDRDGALYVFDLEGRIQKDKVVKGLKRPNNVDVGYGLLLNGKPVDIAITTERMTHKLRVFELPSMKPVDNGGIDVFVGEDSLRYRDLMGVALYKNRQGQLYVIVGRKTGPVDGGYLWQYLLGDDGAGHVKATLVRKFGKFSGKKEIEAIAVDNELGYIYYADEQAGVRQYFADPGKGNEELALFCTSGFAEDQEGISIYKLTDSTGYILISDQGANRFQVFRREGEPGKPYAHAWLKTVQVTATQSDGSETVSVPLNDHFKHGLFVTMSNNKTFHLYRWEDIAGKDLQVR